MKVLIVGVGGVGSVIAQVLLEGETIESVTLVDKNVTQALEVAKRVSGARTQVVQIDANNEDELTAVIEGKDAVINASHPRFNDRIMRLSFRNGANYVDLAGNGLMEQLAQDKAWRDAGLLAITGLGEDPGLSNIYARHAANRLETVDEIRVRDGENSSSSKFPFMLLFSPEVFFAEVFDSPRTFVNGEREASPPLAGREVYDFPEPIGNQPVYLVDHEEVMTLPEYVGKGVKFVDFKLALTDETVAILQMLKKLGLLEGKAAEVRGSKVAPIDLLNAVIPTPVTAAETVAGHTGIVVEVKGRSKGAMTIFKLAVVASHKKAYERFKQNASSFLTGVVPAAVVRMMAEGRISQKGVIPPESLDSDAILRELAREGVSTHLIRTEKREFRA